MTAPRRKFAKGQRLRAKDLQSISERARANQVTVGAPLGSRGGSAGKAIYSLADATRTGCGTFWIRLIDAGTGTKAGFYSWKQIFGVADTYDWVDGTKSGTIADDPAIEANLNARLKGGTRVEVRREAVSNQVRFQLETCEVTTAPQPNPPNPPSPTPAPTPTPNPQPTPSTPPTEPTTTTPPTSPTPTIPGPVQTPTPTPTTFPTTPPWPILTKPLPPYSTPPYFPPPLTPIILMPGPVTTGGGPLGGGSSSSPGTVVFGEGMYPRPTPGPTPGAGGPTIGPAPPP